MPRFPPLSVGIDVSKDTLAVAIRFTDHEAFLTVPNTRNGMTALRRTLRKCACPLIMESTGRYHLLSAFLLSEAGYDVRVINPLQAKRYVSASIRKVKSDRTDASALAQMGITDTKLPGRFTLGKHEIQIRQKVGLLSALERQLQSLTRTLKSYKECHEELGLTLGEAEQEMAALLTKMQKEKDHLALSIVRLIGEDGERRKMRDLACSVPGISELTGSLLVQFLSMHCDHPKQWIAFVGFDVSVRESGTWKGRGKLSKRGFSYLRKRLFSAGWGAAMNHPSFRAYYDRLKEEGSSHREAIVIIARKLLRILFAVLKTGTPFSLEQCRFS
jgi:transposase